MSEAEEETLAAATQDLEARGLRKTVMGAREKYRTGRENVLQKTNYLFAISGRATVIEAIGQIVVAGADPSLGKRMIGIETAILSVKIAITTGSIGIETGTGKGRLIVTERGGQTVTGIAAGTTGIETMTAVEIEAGTAVAIVTALETGIEIGTIVIGTVGGIATTLGHAHVRARLRETGIEKETEISPGNGIGRASVNAIETETGHGTGTGTETRKGSVRREETEKGRARRTETRSGRDLRIKRETVKRKGSGSGTGRLKGTGRRTKIENVGETESRSRPLRPVVAPARGDALRVSLISIATYP
jgi:hypothetical protein